MENELSGQNVYLLRTAYQRKLSTRLGFPQYAGATLQYGNIVTERDELSLENGIGSAAIWAGWKTILGPIYVGYGIADNGSDSFYLNIGGHY